MTATRAPGPPPAVVPPSSGSATTPAPSAVGPASSGSTTTPPPSAVAPVPLGPLESQVMGVLWDGGPASAREVIARLDGARAYTTIATVTTHLEEKGLVRRERVGRAVRFAPTLARHEYCAAMMRHILDAGGNRAEAIACFVDQLDEEDLRVVRRAIAESSGPSR